MPLVKDKKRVAKENRKRIALLASAKSAKSQKASAEGAHSRIDLLASAQSTKTDQNFKNQMRVPTVG